MASDQAATSITFPVKTESGNIIGHGLMGQDGNILIRFDEPLFSEEFRDLAIINLVDGLLIKPSYIPAVEAQRDSEESKEQ